MYVVLMKQRHGFCNNTQVFSQSAIDMQMENLHQRASAFGIIESEQVWIYLFFAFLFILLLNSSLSALKLQKTLDLEG